MPRRCTRSVWTPPHRIPSGQSIARPVVAAVKSAGSARGYVDWQSYAQGEYVGHSRLPHVPEYRIRVDDQIAFVFRLTREETSTPMNCRSATRFASNRSRAIAHPVAAETGRPRGRSHPTRTGSPARWHDHASPARPGSRRPHDDRRPAATPRRALQEILQGAGDHGDADHGQHAAAGPDRLGRCPPGRRWHHS